MHHSKTFRIALSVLTACLLTSCSNQTSDTGLKTVRIAANLPLSGPLAIYGLSIKRGAQLAGEDLRRTDPTGPGFAIDWQDNAGDPQKAISIFQKQMNSEYDIYWSGVNQQIPAIKDPLDKKAMPHFAWVLDPTLNDKREGIASIKNNFRCWVNFKIEPSILLNYVNARKAKSVAIVYAQSPACDAEYRRSFIPALKTMGIKNVLIESYDSKTVDYKSIALKVKDFKPDLIILSGAPLNFVELVRAFRPLGLIHDANTICSYELLDASSTLNQDELEGIRVVAPMFITRSDNAGVKGWTDHFSKKLRLMPTYTDAFAYDAVGIIYDVARHLMLPASSEQWVEALHSAKMDGVTGPMFFDSDGSSCAPVEVGLFKKGGVIPDLQSSPAQK